MVSHHLLRFGGHRHCVGEYTFVVVEGQDFTCPRLDPPLLFISKTHGMPCSHIRNFRRQTH